jgi:hypothetical protein
MPSGFQPGSRPLSVQSHPFRAGEYLAANDRERIIRGLYQESLSWASKKAAGFNPEAQQIRMENPQFILHLMRP